MEHPSRVQAELHLFTVVWDMQGSFVYDEGREEAGSPAPHGVGGDSDDFC